MSSLYGLGLYGEGLYGIGNPFGDGYGGTAALLGDSGIILGRDFIDDDGISWRLQRGSDLWGNAPSPRDVSGERAVAHGQWNATEWLGPRTWNLSIHAHATDHAALHNARHRLTAACSHLPFQVTGTEPFYGLRYAGYRRAGELLWNEDTPGLAIVSVPLIADDPLIRSGGRRAQATFPVSSGGLQWPATWPATWGATVTSGRLQIVNDGNESASILWRIDGPVTDPFIVDEATGLQLRTSLSLTAGQWLTIDTATHRVLANGEPDASRRDRVYGDWFGAAPGESSFMFGAAEGGAGARLSATWTDTWI